MLDVEGISFNLAAHYASEYAFVKKIFDEGLCISTTLTLHCS